MTIRQYQQRVAEFPPVMDGGMKTLDACVLGLVSTTFDATMPQPMNECKPPFVCKAARTPQ